MSPLADSATPDTVDVDATMQWLHDNMPAESGKASVIHNDYKLDNVIFNAETRLRLSACWIGKWLLSEIL